MPKATIDRIRPEPAPAGVHVLPLRVYYEDTDAAGVVYYANYLKYAERARTELLSSLGFENARLAAEERVAFAVRRCEVDYLKPARLDDRLEVVSSITALGGASLDADQVVRRDGQILAVLKIKLACMTADGRPARMPRALHGALETFMAAS